MAYGCNNSVADYKRGISFHTLPLNNPDLLKKWLAKLRLENPPIRKSSRLCSEHFEKDCFERGLRAELMPDVKQRRILKPDAVPTIFAHVKAVKEGPTSTRRLKKREDSDLVEEVLVNQPLIKSVACQTDLTSVTCHLKPVTSMTISLRSICTQTDESYLLTGHKDESTWTQDADLEQQHTIKGTILDYPHASDPIEMLDDQSEFTEDNIHDLSFYSQAESMDTDITDITDKDAEQNNPCERKFIVFESCLNFLLQICPECGHPVEELTKTVKGSLLIVNRTCTKGHCCLWTSQPLLNGMAAGNLLLSAAILFSGCTYRKISHLASIINLQVMAERTFHSIQRKYLFPVVHRAWSAHQQGIFSRNHNTELVLCGDGRCDSPGYSAKYCTYTMMSEDSGEIVTLKIVQVTVVTAQLPWKKRPANDASMNSSQNP